MSLITTKTGFSIDTTKPLRSNLVMYIKDNHGNTAMSKLTYLGHTNPYEQNFRELKCDILVEDQMGEKHEICEDFIWQ